MTNDLDALLVLCIRANSVSLGCVAAQQGDDVAKAVRSSIEAVSSLVHEVQGLRQDVKSLKQECDQLRGLAQVSSLAGRDGPEC